MVTIRFMRLTEDATGRPQATEAGTVTADGTHLTATGDQGLLDTVRQTLMAGVDPTNGASVERALATALNRFRGTYFWAEPVPATGSGGQVLT